MPGGLSRPVIEAGKPRSRDRAGLSAAVTLIAVEVRGMENQQVLPDA
jgi:hypothetical protein